jgi:hypothetical protein
MTNTNVNVGGGKIVSKCIGTVFIQSCDFPDVILKCDNVLFLPDCAKKLIPVSVFLKKQCSVLYSNDPDPNRAVVVKDNNDAPILAGKAADGLYMFHCDAINRTATSHSNHKSKNNAVAMFGIPVGQKMSANSTDFAQRLMEMHSSFGHLHFDKLRRMFGLKKGDNPSCAACTIGKSRRDAKNTNQYVRSTRACHRMWMDIGFTRNNEYTFQLSLDDYHRFSYLEVLKTKDEAYGSWIQLKDQLENDAAPYKFAIIATDSEPLYWTPEWKQHCLDTGIDHEFSSRHRHDMLGVAERGMQTVGEAFRCMMIFSSCPDRDQPDCLRYANVIRNNSPTRANNGWSPREKKAGMRLPPDKNLFRGPFGCLFFAHVYAEERFKHQARAVACTFLGYDQNNNTFLVRELATGRRYYTADGTFHPTIMPHRGGNLNQYDHLAPFVTTDNMNPFIQPDGNDNQPNGDESNLTSRPVRTRMLSDRAVRNIPDVDSAPLNYNTTVTPMDPDDACLHMFGPDPDNMTEALKMYDADDWILARLKEQNSFKHHDVYDLVPRSRARGKKIFRGKEVLKRKINPPTKFNPLSSLDKHKYRLTIAAFTKMLTQGIDYEEKRSNTVRWAAQLMLIAIAVKFDYDILLLDIETFFLYGELSNEVFMEQPAGWEEEGYPREDYVWLVKKSMYGHPSASHCAQQKLREALDSNFHSTASDDCVFVTSDRTTGYSAMGAHVDDMLCVGDVDGLKKSCASLKSKFKITESWNPDNITGAQIERVREKKWLKLHQGAYVTDILSKYSMLDSKTADTPMDKGTAKALMMLPTDSATPASIHAYQVFIGLLIWLLRCRPDMHFTINLGSRFLQCATPQHLALMTNRPLRYLNGCRDHGLVFQPGEVPWQLRAMGDSDLAGDVNSSRSTSGGTARLGEYGTVHCTSHLDKKVATSTGHAETNAHASLAKEVVWERNLLRELEFPMTSPTPIGADNDGVVKQSVKPINHAAAKHYRIAQAYIRSLNDEREIRTHGVNTDDNDADFLTKPLDAKAFLRHRHAIMGPQDPPI